MLLSRREIASTTVRYLTWSKECHQSVSSHISHQCNMINTLSFGPPSILSVTECCQGPQRPLSSRLLSASSASSRNLAPASLALWWLWVSSAPSATQMWWVNTSIILTRGDYVSSEMHKNAIGFVKLFISTRYHRQQPFQMIHPRYNLTVQNVLHISIVIKDWCTSLVIIIGNNSTWLALLWL